MSEDAAQHSSEAPLKRKSEAQVEAADCKKLKDCGAGELTAGENDQLNLISETGEMSPDKGRREMMPDEERRVELKEIGKGKNEEVEEEEEKEEEEEEEEEEDEEDEVSSDLEGDSEDSDEDSEEEEENSDDNSEEENSPKNPGSSSEAKLLSNPAGSSQGLSSKGKEKEDIKGKGIMIDEGKGKGKAVDNQDEGLIDEDDAGYLSEDPLDEVDLNNILPTRTRRRGNQPMHYDFADVSDDDDDDSDA